MYGEPVLTSLSDDEWKMIQQRSVEKQKTSPTEAIINRKKLEKHLAEVNQKRLRVQKRDEEEKLDAPVIEFLQSQEVEVTKLTVEVMVEYLKKLRTKYPIVCKWKENLSRRFESPNSQSKRIIER